MGNRNVLHYVTSTPGRIEFLLNVPLIQLSSEVDYFHKMKSKKLKKLSSGKALSVFLKSVESKLYQNTARKLENSNEDFSVTIVQQHSIFLFLVGDLTKTKFTLKSKFNPNLLKFNHS